MSHSYEEISEMLAAALVAAARNTGNPPQQVAPGQLQWPSTNRVPQYDIPKVTSGIRLSDGAAVWVGPCNWVGELTVNAFLRNQHHYDQAGQEHEIFQVFVGERHGWVLKEHVREL